MTTYAPHDTTRDERVREAWTTYHDRLVELAGAEYDAAEEESWEHLQDTLREIEHDHAAATDAPREAGA